jgi:hypothetical protein
MHHRVEVGRQAMSYTQDRVSLDIGQNTMSSWPTPHLKKNTDAAGFIIIWEKKVGRPGHTHCPRRLAHLLKCIVQPADTILQTAGAADLMHHVAERGHPARAYTLPKEAGPFAQMHCSAGRHLPTDCRCSKPSPAMVLHHRPIQVVQRCHSLDETLAYQGSA